MGSGSAGQEKAGSSVPWKGKEEGKMGNEEKKDGRMSRSSLQMARLINLQMLGIFSICTDADRIAGITKPGQR